MTMAGMTTVSGVEIATSDSLVGATPVELGRMALRLYAIVSLKEEFWIKSCLDPNKFHLYSDFWQTNK